MQQMSEEQMQPMNGQLFVELMSQFFNQRWMLGSSGAMAACLPQKNNVLISPSSVPKERLVEADLFLYSLDINQPLQGPTHLRPSACAPLFVFILQSSPDINCVIHTHSKYANLVCAKLVGKDQLVIKEQEMLKGIFHRQSWQPLRNTDSFVLPIIENAPSEQELLPGLQHAMAKFTHSPAILVRSHGLFVWGPSWQKTKMMLECLEYLLELTWEMGKLEMEMSPTMELES